MVNYECSEVVRPCDKACVYFVKRLLFESVFWELFLMLALFLDMVYKQIWLVNPINNVKQNTQLYNLNSLHL